MKNDSFGNNNLRIWNILWLINWVFWLDIEKYIKIHCLKKTLDLYQQPKRLPKVIKEVKLINYRQILEKEFQEL